MIEASMRTVSSEFRRPTLITFGRPVRVSMIDTVKFSFTVERLAKALKAGTYIDYWVLSRYLPRVSKSNLPFPNYSQKSLV